MQPATSWMLSWTKKHHGTTILWLRFSGASRNLLEERKMYVALAGECFGKPCQSVTKHSDYRSYSGLGPYLGPYWGQLRHAQLACMFTSFSVYTMHPLSPYVLNALNIVQVWRLEKSRALGGHAKSVSGCH